MRKTSKKETKVNQIIEAAVHVMSLKGLSHTKMEDIAQEAGIGKGTLYEYFDSKQELFECMIDHYCKEDEYFLKQLTSLSFKDRLSSIIDYLVEITGRKRFSSMFALHIWAEMTDPEKIVLKEKLRSYYDIYIQIAIIFLINPYSYQNIKEIEINARLLFALFDGLLMQLILYPEIREDKEKIKKGILTMMGYNF